MRAGDRVFLDGGTIGVVVESVSLERARLWVTDADPGGSPLPAGARLNFPDSDLALPPLTADDLEDLSFVVDHADAVVLSFVRTADDVTRLQEHLAALGGEDLGLVLKIETTAGCA